MIYPTGTLYAVFGGYHVAIAAPNRPYRAPGTKYCRESSGSDYNHSIPPNIIA
jgi:hypothetical protein